MYHFQEHLKMLIQTGQVDYVKGKTRDVVTLEKANIHKAASIVLFADGLNVDADERTLLRSLAISRFCRLKNSKKNGTSKDSIYIIAEVNNPNCPWGGGVYSEETLENNKVNNQAEINKLSELANTYPSIIFSLSVGNEACVDWTDHMVPVAQVIEYVKLLKKSTKQPVTFCENYVPWLDKLAPLVEAVDFISIHSYPLWEYKTIVEAIAFTKQNYQAVAERYPHKLVVITEAGWASNSNGLGIPRGNANPLLQKIYYQELSHWCEEDCILTFIFEAFDEPWKGSDDPEEPEKHWGLFYENRSPKLALSRTNNYKSEVSS